MTPEEWEEDASVRALQRHITAMREEGFVFCGAVADVQTHPMERRIMELVGKGFRFCGSNNELLRNANAIDAGAVPVCAARICRKSGQQEPDVQPTQE